MVEKIGPATVDLLADWLRQTDLTIRPVLDLGRADAVDPPDPPAWMRELVILRDGHCVFPHCGRDARACDLDHIEPYVPIDEGGPPGQTRPDNLAPPLSTTPPLQDVHPMALPPASPTAATSGPTPRVTATTCLSEARPDAAAGGSSFPLAAPDETWPHRVTGTPGDTAPPWWGTGAVLGTSHAWVSD
ncbi:hypothetical protein [Nocardioides terrisoli]|uniref:hypothetical protein n=1 Tax=Nocardioides terrisoli TaxID=3388267 RepID=UPI00287BBF0E|nr:hypothetical protein [Nocardioides marmorisolisilvae]